MKKIITKILAVIVIAILIFTPFLLMIDFDRYLPIAVFVWMLSVSYFLFVKNKS